MPWTFAHPAAILPLRRFGAVHLPVAALVVGSMAPDFWYYFGLFRLGGFAHSIPGVLLVCLPAGAIVLVLVRLLRGPAIDLLPQPHRGALRQAALDTAERGARSPVAQAAGLVAGALTHLAWDSFTHGYGYAVQSLAILRVHAFTIAGRDFQVFNVLQHASSAVGVAALLVFYSGWLRKQPIVAQRGAGEGDRARWLLFAGCAAVSVAIAILFAYVLGATGSQFVFRVALCATDVFALLLVASSLVWRDRLRA